MTKNQIVTNLDFLIKNGWVEERVEKYRPPKREIEIEKRTYHLTDAGLHYFERGSKFDVTGGFSGMAFQNIKDSVIVVGVGNVVQRGYLPEQSKLDYIADIETFKAQLAKPYPDKSIIRKLEKLCTLSKIGWLATLIERIYHLIEFLLK